ncbi:MAG: class I SAM-dependent methyltransferase [Actinomycetota bacterium]
MSDQHAPFGADSYGRSFADVYDRWYPTDDSTRSAADRIAALADGGPVLELGVGTGRLALEIADRGVRVVGLDPSEPMLDALRRKDPTLRVTPFVGDAGDPKTWPTERFTVIVANDNLLCNLADAEAQRRCVTAISQHLTSGGHAIIQAFIAAPITERERKLEVRSVDASGVTLIATDADPLSGAVTGAHVELIDGLPPRVRPWRVVPVAIDDLDRWFSDCDMELIGRDGDFDGSPFTPSSAGCVSTYRSP